MMGIEIKEQNVIPIYKNKISDIYVCDVIRIADGALQIVYEFKLNGKTYYTSRYSFSGRVTTNGETPVSDLGYEEEYDINQQIIEFENTIRNNLFSK